MKAIVNGKIIADNRVIDGKTLYYDNKIVSINDDKPDCEYVDAKGLFVCPGLIDVHTHGYMGADVSDGDIDGLTKMSQGIAKNGVTSFLATTMTETYDKITKAFDCARKLKANRAINGANLLGVNMEGPYLSPEKRGAHDIRKLCAPDEEFILNNKDIITITTIAPDAPYALNAIKRVTDVGVKVAIGHTTASFDMTIEAVEAGATQATHTFNAMPELNHRAPGAAGAVMWDDRVYCELICDCYHIHEAWFKLLRRVKGNRLILITDCTRAGGMGDGVYELGGQTMTVNGAKCLLKNGTIAGSVLKLNKAVKNMIEYGEASIPEAISMASINPARAIGFDKSKGSLENGKDADIAIFDKDFETAYTIIGGETAYVRA